jgi:hypothetical protein
MLRRDRIVAASDFLKEFVQPKPASKISKIEHNYLETLSNFGIQFVPIEQLAGAILNGGSLSLCPVNGQGSKTVISTSVIANLAPSVRELVYANPVVITPLARDLAAEKGIRLVEKSEWFKIFAGNKCCFRHRLYHCCHTSIGGSS